MNRIIDAVNRLKTHQKSFFRWEKVHIKLSSLYSQIKRAKKASTTASRWRNERETSRNLREIKALFDVFEEKQMQRISDLWWRTLGECRTNDFEFTLFENIRHKIKEHLYSSDYSVMENQNPWEKQSIDSTKQHSDEIWCLSYFNSVRADRQRQKNTTFVSRTREVVFRSATASDTADARRSYSLRAMHFLHVACCCCFRCDAKSRFLLPYRSFVHQSNRKTECWILVVQ